MLGDLRSTLTRMRAHRFEGDLVRCNLCGADDHRVVGTRDRYFKPLRTVLCAGCGLVFSNPMPRAAGLSEYYEDGYRQHYTGAAKPRRVAVLRSFESAHRRRDLLRPLLHDGTRLLDVGSGGGEFVSYLRQEGVDASGLEPDRSFSEYARGEYDIPVITGNWEDADLGGDRLVDVVTAYHVLEHLRTPLEALRRMHSCLGDGGHLCVSVPDIYNPDGTPYARFHVAHVHNFCRETLIMMALRVGFRVCDEVPTRSTTVVFRKDDPVDDWLIFPDTYEKMAAYFAAHTNLRYFFSAKPYSRWFLRMGDLSRSRLRALAGSSGDTARAAPAPPPPARRDSDDG